MEDKSREVLQKCNKCKTVFKITIIETNMPEPLGYTACCPSCAANGIYDIFPLQPVRELRHEKYKALYGYVIKACKQQDFNIWETSQMMAHVRQAIENMTDEQARNELDKFAKY